MGIFDGFFNPTKNTKKGFKRAQADFNRTRGITDPFFTDALRQGGNANNLLADLLGANGASAQAAALAAFQNSPAFDFNFAEGTRAIDQSAAARGLGQSGTNLKSLQEFGQGLQANEFNNRIAQLAGLGQVGFQGAGGLTNNSQNFGNLAISRGQAEDAGNAAGLGNLFGLAGLFGGFGGGGGFGNGRLF